MSGGLFVARLPARIVCARAPRCQSRGACRSQISTVGGAAVAGAVPPRGASPRVPQRAQRRNGRGARRPALRRGGCGGFFRGAAEGPVRGAGDEAAHRARLVGPLPRGADVRPPAAHVADRPIPAVRALSNRRRLRPVIEARLTPFDVMHAAPQSAKPTFDER